MSNITESAKKDKEKMMATKATNELLTEANNPPTGKRPASPRKKPNLNIMGKTKKLTLTDLTNSNYLYGREHTATFQGSNLTLAMPKKVWQESGMPTTIEVTFK